MLPLEAIAVPHILKFIFTDLIVFDRLLFREIELTALTLMTFSKTMYTCLSVLLTTFHYRVRGTCVPTRAFQTRLVR